MEERSVATEWLEKGISDNVSKSVFCITSVSANRNSMGKAEVRTRTCHNTAVLAISCFACNSKKSCQRRIVTGDLVTGDLVSDQTMENRLRGEEQPSKTATGQITFTHSLRAARITWAHHRQ